jgi:NADPH-dependent ferric siderophore reductase
MTDTSSDTISNDLHRITRVRHELKRRLLTVKRVTSVTPYMKRITLTGDDLEGFVSASYDNHVKVFFPRPGEAEPLMPAFSEGRVLVDESARPIARDYTPRRYDEAAKELDIDFAIHDAGPATTWATQARPGDKVGIGGPRGSFVVPDDFDWYLLIGDETALPAIGRRLEELRPATRAIVIAEVADAAEEQIFASKASVTINWLHRGQQSAGSTTLMEDALRSLKLPVGDGYAFIAAESEVAKRLRRILVDERQHPKVWVKASGYWKGGAENYHEPHDD